MKILVFGINYYPELIGIGKYSTEMAEWFAGETDTVTVITGMPYYPNWEIAPAYKNRFWHKELINRVTVLRAPLYVPGRVSGSQRILHEASFLATSSFLLARQLFRKYDVVIVIAPPLLLGLFGLVYRSFRRALVLYHVQDLQLDAARDLGLIKSKFLLNFLGWIEGRILKGVDYVSTISEGMKQRILVKGVKAEKLIELQNWIDTETLNPAVQDNEFKRALGLQAEKKIVLYAGNLGEKQGLELIIDVAEQMKDSEVVFLVVGNGAFKVQLENMINQKALSNIVIKPLQPIENLEKLLNLASLHLVLQKKAAADLVMPSKLTGILSVGGCALVTASPGTTLFKMITDHQIGMVVEPENPKALEEAIRSALARDLQPIRDRARAFAKAYLDKNTILNQFRSFLLRRISIR